MFGDQHRSEVVGWWRHDGSESRRDQGRYQSCRGLVELGKMFGV